MSVKRVLALAAVIAVLVLTRIANPPKVRADGDRDAAIGEKLIAAWNSHDPDKMLPLFTDDIFYEDVAYAEVSHNHTELRKFAAEEFETVPDLELKLVRAEIRGGHGTVEWSFTGTDKGVYKTGKKFTVRGVSVVDVRDGKISRCLDYYDSAIVMRQVGVLPAQ